MSSVGLDSRIDKVYRRSTFRILVNATLADVIREMRRKNTEELIVTDETGKGLGFIDSRDIVRLIAKKKAKPEIKVKDIMSVPLITIKLSDTIEKACKIMDKFGIHHLVVVNEEGHVKGVINDLDVLKIVVEKKK